MFGLLVAALDVVEAQREGGRDVEADATRPGPGFAGPGNLRVDQTRPLFEHFVRRDIEALPPSGATVRHQYVGLGEEFTELRPAFFALQFEHGGPHPDVRGVVPERVLDIGWPPDVERVGAVQGHSATDRRQAMTWLDESRRMPSSG